MINRFDPVGSTGDVDFQSRKRTVPAEKSEVSHVTLDGKDGNTWEQLLASELELNRNVKSYVKNDHLGFTIPYIYKGRSHSYTPDFLVRLKPGDDGIVRTSSSRSPGARRAPGRPGRRRPPPATPGVPQSTTTVASAVGATSK
jgi:type III restriction enzyme